MSRLPQKRASARTSEAKPQALSGAEDGRSGAGQALLSSAKKREGREDGLSDSRQLNCEATCKERAAVCRGLKSPDVRGRLFFFHDPTHWVASTSPIASSPVGKSLRAPCKLLQGERKLLQGVGKSLVVVNDYQ